MKVITPTRTFEFIVKQQSTFAVQGDGRTEFEARQDAMERFHRLSKSQEITPYYVGPPRIEQDGNVVKRR